MSDITFKHHDPNVMLELWHVTKRFGGLTAVGDVSFKIKKGEIYALIGPNGAGKTTIFNLITGVYALTEGRVIFDGTVVGQGDAIIKDDMRETDVKPFRKQPYDIMSRGMARTFQNIRLFKSETVYNNVLTACHAELDHPPLQNTKGNQHKGDERCCLDKVHRDFAGRGKLAAFNRRHHIGKSKRNHIDEKNQFKCMIHNFEDGFSSPRENRNKLLDLDGKAFLTAVADA